MHSYNEKNKFITNVNYNSWNNLIAHSWEYQLFATFEYDIPQEDYLAEKGMSFLLKAVQRSVYSNQYLKRNDCFKGFSIAERHTKSKIKKNSLHFHNLIHLGSIDLDEKLKIKIENEFERKKLKLITEMKKGKIKQIALAPTAVHLEWNIYNRENLAKYCLKDEDSKVSMIDLNGAENYCHKSEVKLIELQNKYYSALK